MSRTSSSAPIKAAAKKAAKKARGKPDSHKAGKDLRRSFEHLGRVKVLSEVATHRDGSVETLVELANACARGQGYKESADLLRAAEHLAFAGLLREDEEIVTSNLAEEVEHEIEHLSERAERHGAAADSPEAVHEIYRRCVSNAKTAVKGKALRAALEYSRAAEALAHIGPLGSPILSAPQAAKRLVN